MEATDILQREHDVVRLVIDAAAREAAHIRATGEAHVDEVERIVEFLRFFADACHDPKEEDLLFCRLHKRGLSWESEPLAEMLRDHEQLRAILHAVSDWMPLVRSSNDLAMMPLAHNLEAYVELMREHMRKEEISVFPLVDDYLTDDDRSELVLEFTTVECTEIDAGVHEHYYSMAHRLAQSA